jgi:nitrite reductase/ring-hydroxylating ferredoxin subunit
MEPTRASIRKTSAFDGINGNVQNGRDLQIYAMEAQCPHLGADLSHAEIEDYEDDLVAVCPWHRYDFNLKTGDSDTGLKACVYAVEIRQEETDERPATLWIEPPTNEEAWEVVDVRPVSEGESRLCNYFRGRLTWYRSLCRSICQATCPIERPSQFGIRER